MLERPYREVFSEVESSAAQLWNSQDTNKTLLSDNDKPKRYICGMFPYPSGNAHLGHVRVYSLSDTIARLSRFKGFEVLHPIGWDAFGLPAENAATKNNIHPAIWTAKNIGKMENEQLNCLGFSFDWKNQLNTSSPEYYKWTQWLFEKLYEKGLVYREKSWVNWDPIDQTVLANEQVIDGKGWRTGAPVEKRNLEQWFIRITDFAEDLWNGLDELNGWSKEALAVQRNWIGRSEGVEISFPIIGKEQSILVYTTRPDTIFGVTSLVLAPEYPDLMSLVTPEQTKVVTEYVERAIKRSELDRMSDTERTGVFTGTYCRNPLNDDLAPIYVGDYVIASYGAGAIMNVPAHDHRDFDFAKQMNLPIKQVIVPPDGDGSKPLAGAYVDSGIMCNSGAFTGMASEKASEAIAKLVEARNLGKSVVKYRLRDWLVSRQRFWGAPIPMIDCGNDGWLPVPENQLPVQLPDEVSFEVRGKSPLAAVDSFVNTVSPKTGLPARREVDTMDTFMCSSWYIWRFLDVHNTKEAWGEKRAKRWMPVDYYIGGLEHAAQHMIYFRFVSHFLYSIGLTPTKEPVDRFLDNGMVRLGGAKMSKSKGNVIVPTEMVQRFGADALRLYIMSDTPFNRDIDWDDQGIVSKQRFLGQIWDTYKDRKDFFSQKIAEHVVPEDSWERAMVALLYQTAHNVEEDVELRQTFHNGIARLHTFFGSAQPLLKEANTARRKNVSSYVLQNFLKILGIFAPHVAEMLWQETSGCSESLFKQPWVSVDVQYLVQDEVNLAVQVNGKLRGIISVNRGSAQNEVIEMVMSDNNLKRYVAGETFGKTIYVQDKILNFVK